MTKRQGGLEKGVFAAKVCGNERVAGMFYRLKLEFSGAGGQAFGKTLPGQFAELDLSSAKLPAKEDIPEQLADCSQRNILLRRPFSFCNVESKGSLVIAEILYCVLGPATLRMTTLSKGDSVSIIGPLGNGFSVPEGKSRAVLVSGGMGAGPLQHLACFLKANNPEMKVKVLAGAKRKDDFPFKAGQFASCDVQLQLATDDGSAGFAGFVTDCLKGELEKAGRGNQDVIIYACGPEEMLAEAARIAEAYGIACQVSMERRMACGIGLCQSCAVECKLEGSKETVYKLCCKDGPVFDSREIAFNV